MKKFFILAAVWLWGIAAIAGEVWEDELKTAKEQGIRFSEDNRVLLKCPPEVVSVTIPSCVAVIGHKAFDRCTELTGVVIPDSVKRIDAGAFSWCVALNKIELPESIKVIGGQAFSRCKALREIKIPAGVVEIGDGIFAGCDKLTKVTVAASTYNGVKTPAFAVDKSGALIDWNKRKLLYLPLDFRGIYTVPDGVASIGAVAFYCCRKLTGVIFPASVKSIGGKAFYGCSSLTGIKIPAGVPKIGDWTFAKCVSLTGVAIPDSVVEIGKKAFFNCPKLTEVSVSSECKIGTDAISGELIRRRPPQAK